MTALAAIGNCPYKQGAMALITAVTTSISTIAAIANRFIDGVARLQTTFTDC